MTDTATALKPFDLAENATAMQQAAKTMIEAAEELMRLAAAAEYAIEQDLREYRVVPELSSGACSDLRNRASFIATGEDIIDVDEFRRLLEDVEEYAAIVPVYADLHAKTGTGN